MVVEVIHPYVIEPGVRAGFTAAGLPIVSSPHPAELASSQLSAVSPPPAEPSPPTASPAASSAPLTAITG